MRRTRVSRRALLAAVLAIALPLPIVAADQWDPYSTPYRAGTARVMLQDATVVSTDFSRIQIIRKTVDGGGLGLTLCNGFGIAPCDLETAKSGNLRFTANLLLPTCASGQSQFCIEAVSIYRNGSTPTPATFIGEVPGPVVAPVPELDLPAGGGTLLYEARDAVHLGGTRTYTVKALLSMQLDPKTGKFRFSNFATSVDAYRQLQAKSITPFRLVKVPANFAMSPRVDPSVNTFNENEHISLGGGRYLWVGDGLVGVAEDFANDTRVGLVLRLPDDVGGWFNGRMKDPKIQVEPVQKWMNKVTIDAMAIQVPRISAFVPEADFTPLMKRANVRVDVSHSFESGFDAAPQWVEELRPFVNDQAAGVTTAWVLRKSGWSGNACFKGASFDGLVTTNATAYSSEVPDFENGYLNYKVGGLHLMPDGSITQGTYDLILSSEVARCIYGFSNAPISATISIVGEGGENRSIATTVVEEKNGWLKLAAYGFTFSSPTVRVKLTQPEMTPVVTPKKPVKKTIVCVKGKVTKRVTAANPKCPSGFRKR